MSSPLSPLAIGKLDDGQSLNEEEALEAVAKKEAEELAERARELALVLALSKSEQETEIENSQSSQSSDESKEEGDLPDKLAKANEQLLIRGRLLTKLSADLEKANIEIAMLKSMADITPQLTPSTSSSSASSQTDRARPASSSATNIKSLLADISLDNEIDDELIQSAQRRIQLRAEKKALFERELKEEEHDALLEKRFVEKARRLRETELAAEKAAVLHLEEEISKLRQRRELLTQEQDELSK
jgi:hypothetical protein